MLGCRPVPGDRVGCAVGRAADQPDAAGHAAHVDDAAMSSGGHCGSKRRHEQERCANVAGEHLVERRDVELRRGHACRHLPICEAGEETRDHTSTSVNGALREVDEFFPAGPSRAQTVHVARDAVSVLIADDPQRFRDWFVVGGIGNRILTSVPPGASWVMTYSSENWAMRASPKPRPGS